MPESVLLVRNKAPPFLIPTPPLPESVLPVRVAVPVALLEMALFPLLESELPVLVRLLVL